MNIFKLVGSIMVDSSDADKSLQKTDKNVEGVGGKFLKGIGTAAKWGAGLALAAGTAAAAVIGLSINVGEDLQKALNGLQAETGTTDEAMKGMKDSMLAIYNNNFGESFEDIGKAMATVAQATGLTGEELEKATQTALMMRDTFEMDVNGSIVAVDQMMKQFGLTSEESYNLLAQGAQSGMNSQGDLVDIIKEYSGQFASMGFSAEETFNMLNNGAKAGGFSIDVMGDSMKEFNIRTRDGSDATAEAFTSLGLNAGDLSKAFNKGGEDGKKAFDDVMGKLAEMKDPMEQNQAGVALFGTMWEDLGAEAILALGNTKGGIESAKDALERINAGKYNTFGEAMQGIKRNLETGILLPISEKILPVLGDFSKWMIDKMPVIKEKVTIIMDNIGKAFDVASKEVKKVVDALVEVGKWISENQTLVENIAIVVGSLAASWGLVNTSIAIWNVIGVIGAGVTWLMAYGTTAFGLALLSVNWPLVLIVAGIAAIIAIGVLLYKNWDVVKAKLIQFKDAMVSKFNEIKTNVVNKVTQLKDGVVNKFNEIKADVISKVLELKNGVVNKFSEMKTNIVNKVLEIKNGVVNKFNEIKGGAVTAFNNVKNAVMTPINNMKDKIKSVIDAIKEFFTNLKLKIPEISIPKLPKLKVTGKFSVAPPSIPKFNWYAKGGEFNKPTIAGLGEDGREAIVPLEKNTGWADRVASLLNSKSDGTNKNGSIILNIENFINNREQDIKAIMEEIEFYRKQAALGR